MKYTLWAQDKRKVVNIINLLLYLLVLGMDMRLDMTHQ